MRHRLRLALLAACALLVPLAASPSQAATARQPILFVHGWNSSSSTWTTMINNFKAAGYTDAELSNWSYDTSRSNVTTAQDVATKVDQLIASSGWSKVNLIAHSMGSLSTRYYLKNLGGTAKVDDWVSLGGPNHGTDTANLCTQTSCRKMRIGSTFLASLNAGDETPGTTTTYQTWWSPCDTVINPDSSVSVSGGTNTKTACLGHSNLQTDATVFGQVRTAVES